MTVAPPKAPRRHHAPLIHVGYHKTGSSWLQQRVFSNESSGFFMRWPWGWEFVLQQFIQVNPFAFDEHLAREAYAPDLQHAADRSLVLAISHESLSGNPTRGDYYGRDAAKRLVRTFPEASILICIREQKSLLLSLYRQHVLQWGYRSIDRFIEDVDDPRRSFAPCRLFHFEYHHLIQMYQSLFGEQRVLVLPFELLRSSPAAFLERLRSFVGLSGPFDVPVDQVNVGLKGMDLIIRRRLNRVLSSAHAGRRIGNAATRLAGRIAKCYPQRFSDRREAELRSFIARNVGDRYGASNDLTSRLINCDLRVYGYQSQSTKEHDERYPASSEVAPAAGPSARLQL